MPNILMGFPVLGCAEFVRGGPVTRKRPGNPAFVLVGVERLELSTSSLSS